jgi:iron uptake system component EfeO
MNALRCRRLQWESRLHRKIGRADEGSSARFHSFLEASVPRIARLARAVHFGTGLVLAMLAVAMATAGHAASVDEAIEQYRSLLIQDIDGAVANAEKLRARIVADDLAGAKQAWIDARIGWERSEVFTSGFVPEPDQKIDAWPNGVVGFHAIEAKLFGARKTDVGPEVDGLLADLSELSATVREIELTLQGLLNGVARLAYEVGESKVDGGESRVSGTSLDDMRNNVDGIDLAYRILFASTVEANDAELAGEARHQIDELKSMVAPRDIRAIDPDRLRATSEELVLTLQNAAPKLGLERPQLEANAK